MASHSCLIALDLGTTAFKCAPVDETGLLAEPTSVAYNLDYDAGLVTFRPERYLQIAEEALAGAARSARNARLSIAGIGITSQAQTYVALDRRGVPLQTAVVWTDDRATEEAREAAAAIPDFVHHSGFKSPLPGMFLSKVRHFARHSRIPVGEVWKFLLLNEYVIYRLTGAAYGDETNQGMSGFYHIAERRLSPVALGYAGIDSSQLAQVAPAGRISHWLVDDSCQRLGLESVPVYSCGNDQSSAAAGAGLGTRGDVLCNFGTAMVVYALRNDLPDQLLDKQIAGISPFTDGYFLLGLESECGNVLDWAQRVLYAGCDFSAMMTDALAVTPTPGSQLKVSLPGGGRIEIAGLTVGSEGRHLVRALLDLYGANFGELLAGVSSESSRVPASRARISERVVMAAGGLSRSAAWLDYLGRRFGLRFGHSQCEQPGLCGVARIVRRASPV